MNRLHAKTVLLGLLCCCLPVLFSTRDVLAQDTTTTAADDTTTADDTASENELGLDSDGHKGEDACPPETCEWGWSKVKPLGDQKTYNPTPTPTPNQCGDMYCNEATETADSCPSDCGMCGDGDCWGPMESVANCPKDCHTCGDNLCSEPFENNESCPKDCSRCGDGICDCIGENINTCPQDCSTCGDNVCSPNENAETCPKDCAECGDGICSAGENCPKDCHQCGDGKCDEEFGECLANCVQDCTVCGDHVCSAGETQHNCPKDCGNPTPTPTPTAPPTPVPTPPPLNCPPGKPLSCNEKLGICACGRCADDPFHKECLGCFSPETKIVMADKSERSISHIRAGDKVWNPISQKAMTVKYPTVGPEDVPMYKVGFGTTAVVITEGHPMVVNNSALEADWMNLRGVISPASLKGGSPAPKLPAGYIVKRANELKTGDRILSKDGKFREITVLQKLPVKSDQMVHNLMLDTDSTNPDDHMLIADGVITGDLFLQEQVDKK